MTGRDGPGPVARIPAVDVARSTALVGMAVFHFTYDLALFGYIPPATPVTGGWAVFSRLVAGSFIFLAGVSLWLAHGRGLRAGAFLRRLAVLAAAAALVTAASFAFAPDRFIFYGILHSIAVSSVLGLVFLRLPTAVTLAAAGAVFALPRIVQAPVFDAPWLVWLGLGTRTPPTMDFEPLFPWFGPFLLGLAAARLADRAGLLARAIDDAPGPSVRMLAWPGRHSLAIYLVHQPVLIVLLWVWTAAVR